MPVNRNAEHHRERMIDALKEEIGTLIEGELRHPRIGLCHVTEILLAPGGKAARVMVEVEGTEEEAEVTMTALLAARAFIRVEVRARMGKRHVPELTFHRNRSRQMGGRIAELLGRVEKRKKKKK